jgi:hypothetical protein
MTKIKMFIRNMPIIRQLDVFIVLSGKVHINRHILRHEGFKSYLC